MDILFYFLIFIFGTFIGSFLGVIIYRLPRGENIVRGRSHCDHCNKSLHAFDLIPLFSFLLLRGRCRYCGTKLSWFYPSVEIITGFLFVLVALHTGILYQVSPLRLSGFEGQASITYMVELVYYLLIVSILIAIFFIDLKHGIIPFSLVASGTLITFVYLLFNIKYMILGNIVAGLGAFLFFFLIFLFTRGRGMGFGDVVYVFFMGLLLGFPGIVFGLYIAFVSGAIVSLILVGLQLKKLKGGTVPFGPFLVLGTFIALFWGKEISSLFTGYLGV